MIIYSLFYSTKFSLNLIWRLCYLNNMDCSSSLSNPFFASLTTTAKLITKPNIIIKKTIDVKYFISLTSFYLSSRFNSCSSSVRFLPLSNKSRLLFSRDTCRFTSMPIIHNDIIVKKPIRSVLLILNSFLMHKRF